MVRMNNRNSIETLPLREKFSIILNKPENPENIGLVARSMKNTGFEDLRLVGLSSFEKKTILTAVHAHEILANARFFLDLTAATQDLDVIFAATSKARKNFSVLSLEKAVEKMFGLARETKIGLLFGNERTGLTSKELLRSNFRFKIPQASRQPSYNVASAVLVTLFSIFSAKASDGAAVSGRPIPRKEQEACCERILINLAKKGFIHQTNKKHMEERICDLLGRLVLTAEDRNLLLALFSKGMK